jgi:hypothetical protein
MWCIPGADLLFGLVTGEMEGLSISSCCFGLLYENNNYKYKISLNNTELFMCITVCGSIFM